jgi:hypothetical protein
LVALQHLIHLVERFHQRLFWSKLANDTRNHLRHIFCTKLAHFFPTVAVKHGKHRHILRAGQLKLTHVCILHVLSPALHFTNTKGKPRISIIKTIFDGAWGAKIGAHVKKALPNRPKAFASRNFDISRVFLPPRYACIWPV